ncbi:hypothetical protein C1280_24920 [Gemmata obscuriglobus]|uniref:DUF7919 domain-containing protein n=2 Tax=Gemmata obscuriglobus TaxID=114 RepID=A0A2Z3HAA8_9BACT|nr:hypothetical protein C1280_24920 [Gemmata obscuriglobus]
MPNCEVVAMFFPDLGTTCQVDRGDHVRAVGWLHPDHSFPTGPVPPGFSAALRAHAYDSWQPVLAMGPHFCELCSHPAPGADRAGGARNFWIPSMSVVYVAPELIVHYVEDHQYQPPEEFVAAVLACPPQKSDAFLEMLRPFGYT